MSSRLYKIFKKDKGIIIGAIHFPPLLGYPEFPDIEVVLSSVMKDLKAFEQGGVDGVIIENNYDIPHKIFVGPEIVSAMTFLGTKVASFTKLPIGVSVLWNDYRAALSIAKTIGAKFIRIPVFVDKAETSYGIVEGQPKDVIKFRKLVGAESVVLFTDIHVKHAKIISKYNLQTSAKLAIKNKSDAVIVTGKWTGDAPNIDKLIAVRKAVGDFPILVGSGADKENIHALLNYANGVIVSTSLKEGGVKKGEVNIKKWGQRISRDKVKSLIQEIK